MSDQISNVGFIIEDSNNPVRKRAGKLADEFEALAKDLDGHTRNVNIARVIGGAVGASGAVVSAIGFVAIPFTAGSSALVAGIGGGIAAAAGGLTAGGAKIAQIIIEKQKHKDIPIKWSEFCKLLNEALKHDPEKLKCTQDAVVGSLTRMGISTVEVVKDVGVAVVRVSKATTSIAGAGSRVAVAVASGSVVLNVLTLGLSIYDIIDGSLEISREKKSKAGDAMREMAGALRAFAVTGQL